MSKKTDDLVELRELFALENAEDKQRMQLFLEKLLEEQVRALKEDEKQLVKRLESSPMHTEEQLRELTKEMKSTAVEENDTSLEPPRKATKVLHFLLPREEISSASRFVGTTPARAIPPSNTVMGTVRALYFAARSGKNWASMTLRVTDGDETARSNAVRTAWGQWGHARAMNTSR